MQWQKDRRTDNAMTKRQKDRQCNDKKTEGQTMQWQKNRRTDNAMTKRQDRQCNDKKTEGQTMQWQKDRRTDNAMTKRNNDLYDITPETKHRATRNQQKRG